MDRIERYFQTAKYDEALALINEIDNEYALDDPSRLKTQIFLSRIYEKIGEYDNANRVASEILALCGEDYKSIQLAANTALLYVLFRLGQIESCNLVLETCENLLNEMNEQERNSRYTRKWEGTYYHVKGALLDDQGGKFEEALDYMEKALEIRKEIYDLYELASTVNNIGVAYWYHGEPVKALDYFEQSLEIDRKIGNEQKIAITLLNIGEVYVSRGEVTKAMEYFNESIELKKKYSNKQSLAVGLDNLGRAYLKQNKFDIALEYFKKSYDLHKEIGNRVTLSAVLYYLVVTLIKLDRLDEVKPLIDELQEINTIIDNNHVEVRYKMALGTYFMHTGGAKNMLKGHNLFEEVVNGEIVDFELTVVAIINLCELQIKEYRAFQDDDLITEIEALIDRIVKIGSRYKSYLIKIEGLLLKSKFSLIRSNIDTAHKLMNEADQIAKDQGLKALQKRISHERDIILRQIEYLNEVISKNKSLFERIEETEIIEYLEHVTNILQV